MTDVTTLDPPPARLGDTGDEAAAAVEEKVGILLVDDQPANLVALEAMLEELGQHLVQATSGREALKAMLAQDFAVVLLDVKMPDMDGFETASLIRERDRSRHTPIIFLTAADRAQTDAVRGYAVGAVDYLAKPIVPEFVRSKVAVFVELAKKTAQLERQTARLMASEQAARELAHARADLVRHLENKNRELESFSYAVSHDLRAPLRRIDSFGRALEDTQAERLDDRGRHYLGRVCESTEHMSQVIDDVLHLARVSQQTVRWHETDVSDVVRAVVDRLREADPARAVEVRIRPGVTVRCDPRLLRLALDNLIGNAWKFSRQRADALIEFGIVPGGDPAYFVRDNGVGFDMTYADRLFAPFQRLHEGPEFAGTGIGLATVQRIVHQHGGQIWAESAPGQGATFYFTLGGEPGTPVP